MERVAIFIDGSNLYHILKSLSKNKKPFDFDFEKFTSYLIRDRKLTKVYYYNAPLDRGKDEETYVKQQKFFENIKRLPNFEFILCRMQKRKVENITIYEVKEDDIHLAVDMVRLAYKNDYDTAIIISTDGDFVPAVKAIQEIGKKVENIGFENKFSWHLRQTCDFFSILRKELLDKFYK